MLSRHWIAPCLAAALAVGTALQCHIGNAAEAAQGGWLPALLYGAMLWFWWAAVWSILWLAGRRWPQLWSVSARNALLQLSVAVTLALVHLQLLALGVQAMIAHWPYLEGLGYGAIAHPTFSRIGLEVLLYIVTWAGCAAAYLQIVKQQEALQNAELRQQLSLAQLRALQMQLKPHFLFNTLNALTTLVELGRQKEAIEVLSHLNAILKATLVHETAEKVALARELEVIESYLAIEQIRFADRLRVELAVDPRALEGLVPCFLLQPIVENAVRHGIAQVEDEGVIRASIERRGELLHVLVRDNGPGLSQHTGHGIGLRNTEDRLARMYPRRYAFSSGAVDSGGFEVHITIPFERMPA
jgi:Histidine kinase